MKKHKMVITISCALLVAAIAVAGFVLRNNHQKALAAIGRDVETTSAIKETVAATPVETSQPAMVIFTTREESTAQPRQTTVPGGVVRPGDTPSPVKVNEKYRVATGDDVLRMRSGPSTEYPVISTISADSVITVSYTYNHWGYVAYRDESGWCFMEYLRQYNDWY